MSPDVPTPSILYSFTVLVTGLLMLVGGGESLVGGATRLARRFGMSPLAIGLTVVAFGTSVPELFVSINASLQGHPDIMIGNVVGSNIANVGLILGCCALLAPLHLRLHEVRLELLLVTIGSLILMACSLYGSFPRLIGLVFILVLISFTAFIYIKSKNKLENDNGNDTDTSLRSLLVLLLLIICGLILLSFGSTLFIDGAINVARHFGVSELVIGLTLAAVGTSLPELASSIAALRQKTTSLLIGNVIGSNMFNLFMVLGLTGLLKPFRLEADLLVRDLPVMLAFTLILIPILAREGATKKWHGLVLLTAYAGYCFSLL